MELNQNTEKLDNYRKRAAELVGKMTKRGPDSVSGTGGGTVKYKGL